MKTSVSFSFLSALALLAGSSDAFYGQLTLNYECSEGCNQFLGLRDYNTGSTYNCGTVDPSFCTYEGRCPVYCSETSSGGYDFNAQFWQTSDGCDNVDFEGGLGAGHGYCCGGAPCDIRA